MISEKIPDFKPVKGVHLGNGISGRFWRAGHSVGQHVDRVAT